MAAKKPMKKPVKRVRRFQDGGETADKMAGLAASNMDAPMGFFERLRMGNIDQEGSQAYNRLGAGRAKMDRDAASELAANRMVDEARSAKGISNYQQSVDQDEMDRGADMRNYEMMQRGRAEGERDEKRMAPSSVAQAQNAAILAGKVKPAASKLAASKPATKPAAVASKPAATSAAAAAAPAAAPSSDTRANVQAIPGQPPVPAAVAGGDRVTDMSNLDMLLAGTGVGGGVLGAAKLKKMYDAQKAARLNASKLGAAKRAILKKQTEEAIDTNLLDEFQGLASAAAKQSKKKGGAVKKMAHGGSVKSSVSAASKRGDGIALRGKTRGKIY